MRRLRSKALQRQLQPTSVREAYRTINTTSNPAQVQNAQFFLNSLSEDERLLRDRAEQQETPRTKSFHRGVPSLLRSYRIGRIKR